MPQGFRKDFSGKQKKAQLKDKRTRKANQGPNEEKETISGPTSRNERGDSATVIPQQQQKSATNPDQTFSLIESVQLSSRTKSGREKYDLRFRVETKEAIAKLREEARKPIKPFEGIEGLITNGDDYFPPDVDIPSRPPWDPSLSKTALDRSEERYFQQYCANVIHKHENTSHFELNLETWRQLWRVIEMSDILLLIVDCRYPSAMFPPSLYKMIRELGKDLILVLNKVDLVPIPLVLGWEKFFKERYPEIQIAFFSSCPNYNLRVTIDNECPGLRFRRLRGRIQMVSEGALNVLNACETIVNREKAEVDLTGWKALIEEAARRRNAKQPTAEEEQTALWQSTGQEICDDQSTTIKPNQQQKRFQNHLLTLGMLGTPNAGKSSLINSLVGKRVVSVSKTPGHTKHFQTIFITKSVKLCDCPGLVFPSLVPKPLQVLMGSFPISQVREPFSVVKFLSERVDLVSILRLTFPGDDRKPHEQMKETKRLVENWTAYDICEAWAWKRGYVAARSNRPDMNRAANHILRMTLEGKICLLLYPEGFQSSLNEESSELDRVKAIENLLGMNVVAEVEEEEGVDDSEIDSDDEAGEEKDQEEAKVEKPAEIRNKFSALMCDDDDEDGESD